MQAHEIPQPEWPSFLEGFATQHQGWLASLERRQHGNGSLAVLDNQALKTIYLEKEGSGRIAFVFGHPDGWQTTEMVKGPTRIKFLETAPGGHAGLEIESADGTSLVLRFRSAMPPEMIDGIAA